MTGEIHTEEEKSQRTLSFTVTDEGQYPDFYGVLSAFRDYHPGYEFTYKDTSPYYSGHEFVDTRISTGVFTLSFEGRPLIELGQRNKFSNYGDTWESGRVSVFLIDSDNPHARELFGQCRLLVPKPPDSKAESKFL